MLLNFCVCISYLLHSSLGFLSLCLASGLPSDESETVMSLESSLCVPLEYIHKIPISRSFLCEQFVFLLLGFQTELNLCINLFT